KAKTEIFDLTYRHAKAAALTLAQPSDAAVTLAAPVSAGAPASLRGTQLKLPDSIPLFASLTEDEKEALASTIARRSFRQVDLLVEQGSVLKALMSLRSGVALVTKRDDNGSGAAAELDRLAPGDFFGEGGLLTGAGEPGSITALTSVVVYEITQEGLGALMR